MAGKDALETYVDFETKRVRLLQADHLGHFVQQRPSNESFKGFKVKIPILVSSLCRKDWDWVNEVNNFPLQYSSWQKSFHHHVIVIGPLPSWHHLRDSFALFLTTDMLLLSITFFYTGLQVNLQNLKLEDFSSKIISTWLQLHLRQELWWTIPAFYNFCLLLKNQSLASDSEKAMENLQVVPP